MGVLDRLPVVFVGLEHLNLEGMVGPFVDEQEGSTLDQLRGYSRLFLTEGESLWATRVWVDRRHLELPQCGSFDRLPRLDLPAETIVPVNRLRASMVGAQPEFFDLHALPEAPLFVAE